MPCNSRKRIADGKIARSDVTEEQKADAYDPDDEGLRRLPFAGLRGVAVPSQGCCGPGAIHPAVLAGIAWDLKERDVSHFKIGEASMTEAKAEIAIQRNLPPLQRAVVEPFSRQ